MNVPSFVDIGIVVVEMFLACHVISQDHVIKRSSNIIGRSPSKLVTILPSLVVIGIVIVKMFLVHHVIYRDHVITLSCDFKGGNSSW